MLNHIPYMIENYPRTSVVALIIGLLFTAWIIREIEAGQSAREAEHKAYWEARFACRQSGGTYERFGPLGYQCIQSR